MHKREEVINRGTQDDDPKKETSYSHLVYLHISSKIGYKYSKIKEPRKRAQ